MNQLTCCGAVLTVITMLGGAAAAEPRAPQRGGARGSAQSPPPGWSDTLAKTLDLTIAGKSREVIAIYEQWVARYPDFAEAHLMLGGAFESLGLETLASRVPDAAFTALKDFETAATHLRRGFDLGGGETPSIAIGSLVDIYGPLRLRLPDQQRAFVREALAKYPAEPRAHFEHIKLLMIDGEPAAAVDRAVLAARTAVPKTAERRIELATLLEQVGEEFPGAGVAETVVGEAVAVLDEVLKTNASDRKALEEKARALRTQAKLVKDPARARILLAEAERASEQARILRERRRG
jgi:hypothetical protein